MSNITTKTILNTGKTQFLTAGTILTPIVTLIDQYAGAGVGALFAIYAVYVGIISSERFTIIEIDEDELDEISLEDVCKILEGEEDER